MAAAGKDDSARYFPATAMPDRDWWQALWPNPERTLRRVGVAPGLRVIDVCCGDGYFTAAIARIVAPEEVVALDLSEEMLRQARSEVAARGADNVTFVAGDACDLPRLVTGIAQLVLIANTFHGVPDKTGLARAVRPVLAPEGRFVVINWHALPREQTTVLGAPRGPRTELRMTPGSVLEAVRPAGFEEVERVELPPFHYAVILAPA